MNGNGHGNGHEKFRRVAGLALLMLVASGAAAQTASSPPTPLSAQVGDPTCLVSQDDRCALRCARREIELQVLPTGEITVVMQGIDRAEPTGIAQSISVQQDLQMQVQAGSVNLADANLVLQELSTTDGALYTVPNFAQLKSDLGFPEAQEFAAGDWPDLLRADLQRVLGVGSVTASYLASRVETHAPDKVALESATTPNRN